MGLKPDEYFNYEIGHFVELITGYTNKVKREQDINLSLHSAIRKQAFFSLLPHAEKGFTFMTFQKHWPLPGDEHVTDEKITMTKDDFENAYAEMKRRVQLSRRNKQKQNAGARPYLKGKLK